MQKGNVVSVKHFDNRMACDPNRSVMVSACAGSGKTWLLVARMVRILLAGAKPHEILALTFTRKAAQEMRDRLYGLLEQFSTIHDQALLAELSARGLTEAEARALLPKARSLYEDVLANPQAIVIDTFHGWFGRLLGAAPVSTGIQPGFALREDSKRLQDECLDDWWSNLPSNLKPDYDTLLHILGAHQTQAFLVGAYSVFKQRGAWTFFQERCATLGTDPVGQLQQSLTHVVAPNPLLAMWNAPNAMTDLEFLARCFANSNKTERAYLEVVEHAIEAKKAGIDLTSTGEWISQWQDVFLTGDLTRRSSNNKASRDLKKWLEKNQESSREAEHVAYKEAWADAFMLYVERQREQTALQLNTAWFALSAAMTQHVQERKEAMRVRDFDDLEIGVSQLMADSAHAAYLQARLDARYQHILVDEFQDTNPLQWQILRSWLDGYGSDSAKPSIFIVGDPKQSIYRFRRADPRLFFNARQYLERQLGACYLEQNTTRRNAPAINAAVNRTFSAEHLPEGYVFHEQTTLWSPPDGSLGMPNDCSEGEAYLLSLIPDQERIPVDRVGNAFDMALADPLQTGDVAQRYEEGRRIARIICKVMQSRHVLDEVNGQKIWRSAKPSDFLLLVKRRQYLPQYERALREAGLVFESSRLGGLLNTLEIDDLIALLTVLVTPRHDLPLAQVLRSPIFNLNESQMQSLSIAIATKGYLSWWDALQDSSDVQLKRAAHYLEHWRVLAQHLPAHDLLDRIYHECDLRFQYACASPDLSRTQVLANLDAFLELALNQDGGRYPSLSRFIQEMNAMRRGDDQETPDEGDSDLGGDDTDLVDLHDDSALTDEERSQRVRIMTVHGAKGLEAPFVMLLDANHTTGLIEHRGVLMDWPPDSESPVHFSAYTKETLTSPRSGIRDEELRIGQNENWNVLYVAMTRAKQGLWISGVAKSSTKDGGVDPKSWYARAQFAGITPYSESEEELNAIEASNEGGNRTLAHGEQAAFAIHDFVLHWSKALESQAAQGRKIEGGIDLGIIGPAEPMQPEVVAENEPDPAILEEGVHFHLLLEHLTAQTGRAPTELPALSELINWLDIDEAKAQLALARAITVLQTETLKPYLVGGQWVQAWNELDIFIREDQDKANGEATPKMSSARIDRLVEFADRLVILDYKLTLPAPSDTKYNRYHAQLQRYATSLSRIRSDKPIEAYLISAKGEMLQMV